MRTSVTLLRYDHGLIHQVTDVMIEVIMHRSADKHLADLKEIIGFHDKFTDKFHHHKEEYFLFPVAVEFEGITYKEMATLIADHKQLRGQIRSLKKDLVSNDLESFYRDGYAFVDTIQRHMRHEEDNFFPSIEDKMSLDIDSQLYERFEKFMASDFDPDLYNITEGFANRIQDEVLGSGYYERKSSQFS